MTNYRYDSANTAPIVNERAELESKLEELMRARGKWTLGYRDHLSLCDDDLLRHLICHYGGAGGPFISHG